MEYPNELVEAVKAVADAINGGGNENSREVITETALSPFGNITEDEFNTLWQGLKDGNISGIISFDCNALGLTDPIIEPLYIDGWSQDKIILAQGNNMLGPSAFSAAYYFEGGGFNVTLSTLDTGEVTNITAYAELIPTVTNIFYHPMPEE